MKTNGNLLTFDTSVFIDSLPSDPTEAMRSVVEYLRDEGFVYALNVFAPRDVMSTKSGNCLGLSMLVTKLLRSCGKFPKSRILVRPLDASDKADKKLFRGLMSGDYFDYDRPVLPKRSDRLSYDQKSNRFVSLAHPMVILEGVPLETTLATENETDPLIEFPAEAAFDVDAKILESFVLSDETKLALASKRRDEDHSATKMQQLFHAIQKSLEIFPDNRDALMNLWRYGCARNDEGLRKQAERRLLGFGPADSDLSYKLWCITGNVRYLDITLEQFPEHMPAFVERRVLMEKNDREARMNLAVALWCINYSGMLDLDVFLRDPSVQQKVSLLFPNHR